MPGLEQWAAWSQDAASWVADYPVAALLILVALGAVAAAVRNAAPLVVLVVLAAVVFVPGLALQVTEWAAGSLVGEGTE